MKILDNVTSAVRDDLMPGGTTEIDVLNATDCISEDQNLKDCGCLPRIWTKVCCAGLTGRFRITSCFCWNAKAGIRLLSVTRRCCG